MKKETITKDEVIGGIETCTQLLQVWGTYKYPNNSFASDVRDLRTLLKKLLKVSGEIN